MDKILILFEKWNNSKVKDRLKSTTVWAGIIAQICVILTLTSGEAVTTEFKIIATSLLEILTLVGILNNPADRGGF